MFRREDFRLRPLYTFILIIVLAIAATAIVWLHGDDEIGVAQSPLDREPMVPAVNQVRAPRESSGSEVPLEEIENSSAPSEVANGESLASLAERMYEPDLPMNPSDDGRINNEPVDPNWAPGLESQLWAVVSTVGEVVDIKCHTTFCRAVIVPGDRPQTGQDRVLTSSIKSIVDNSGGRLRAAQIRSHDDPELPTAYSILVYGHPVDDGQIKSSGQ